ncbi:hypothetical protein [Brevundimonas goettingensis]|uniref:Uncharacterized protein n=1 Tax=Brevundimonas goettingensis TaxID=2774190 RepID=A0A975GW86_9CAUL|nr:hypothetical protein [Brevundimonas goettingensis]QTC92322.1 hypothetical protein IFJ75_05360 [Brevundimonas goettingensis]
MRIRPKAFAGQVIADLLLVSLLAVVTGLIGLRSVVRGARAVGILPPKPSSVAC